MNIPFSIKDAIDVLFVAFFIYQIYNLMKKSGTLSIFNGVVSVLLVWIIVSQVLEMRLMGAILDKFISVGFLVIVILFQDDIRRFLVALGSHKGWKVIAQFFVKKTDQDAKTKYIAPIVMACISMARKKTGALIVIQEDIDLTSYIQTGEMFNADVNARLIENIFFKNSPMHDGAMIISRGKIKAAGCILPVAQDMNIPKDLGLRHRAALGLSHETDAYIIIVSEERGSISLAHEGKIHVDISGEALQQLLSDENKF